MQVAFLTVLIVAGAGQPAPGPMEPPVAVAAPMPEDGPACATCPGAPVKEGYFAGARKWVCDWLGPMPQTCYSPRFGCYPGNGRDIQRYPAFHGYYYREPYNYRHYFDYPWHAQPHEPLPYFSHRGGPTPDGGLMPTPDPGMSPAVPAPAVGPQPPALPAPMPLQEPQARAQNPGKAKLLGR
jgi:hypothetical protein